jgi:DNA-binding CsgD family transcriptional regulator
VEFRHSLVRSAVHQQASATRRRRGHAAVAAALESAARPEHRARRAWHLAAAVVGTDEATARLLEEFAARSVLVAGFAPAATAYERAAQLSPANADRRRRYLAAADAAQHAGQLERARELLGEAEHLEPPDLASEAAAVEVASRLDLAQGQPKAALDRLVQAANRIAGVEPARATQLLAEAVTASGFIGDTNTALEAARRAVELAAAEPLTAASARLMLGGVHLLRGESQDGLPLIEGSDDTLIPLVESAPQFLPLLASVAFCWSLVDAFARADRVFEVVISQATRLGAAAALPFPLAQQAVNQYRCGDWPCAAATAERALLLARDICREHDVANALIATALVDAGRGRADPCRENAEEAVRVTTRTGVTSAEAQAYYVLGLLDLGVGDSAAAAGQLERSRTLCEDLGLLELAHWQWAPELAEAYARMGRAADAEQVVRRLEWHAARTSRPIVLALARRCRAMVLTDDYEQAFREALDWHDQAERSFERARTQLCFGERLRRSKHRAAARTQLESAWRTFRQLGATPWESRASAELTATGATLTASTDSNTAALLTPQELQVAQIVAAGVSNREAATQLFLSPKTVEYHLSRVYRKLRIDSRDQLADAL